eukprot:8545938-Pyramimonas_sp.AAC.1
MCIRDSPRGVRRTEIPRGSREAPEAPKWDTRGPQEAPQKAEEVPRSLPSRPEEAQPIVFPSAFDGF